MLITSNYSVFFFKTKRKKWPQSSINLKNVAEDSIIESEGIWGYTLVFNCACTQRRPVFT